MTLHPIQRVPDHDPDDEREAMKTRLQNTERHGGAALGSAASQHRGPMLKGGALLALLVLALTMLSLSVLSLLPQAVAAQAGSMTAEEQSLRGYVLRREMLDKLLAFKIDADQLEKSKPKSDRTAMPKSVADLIRSVEDDPRAAPLLRRHGLTAREYIIAYLALTRARIAGELGMNSARDIDDAGTNAANLAFYRDNKQAVDALFAKREDDDADAEEHDEGGDLDDGAVEDAAEPQAGA